MIPASLKNDILRIMHSYRPKYLAVFGSRSRGDETVESDLDLLVEFDHTLNLIELIGIEQELSETLGFKVDLVTRASLSKHLKPYIEKDLIVLING